MNKQLQNNQNSTQERVQNPQINITGKGTKPSQKQDFDSQNVLVKNENRKTTSAVINGMISDILDDEDSDKHSVESKNDNEKSSSIDLQPKDLELKIGKQKPVNCEDQDSVASSEHEFQSCQDGSEMQKKSEQYPYPGSYQQQQTQLEIGTNISQNHYDAKSYNDERSYASFLDDQRSFQHLSNDLAQVQSYHGSYSQMQNSTLATQNNNSNYKNDFQDLPNYNMMSNESHGQNRMREQPLMVIGIQNLPINPNLQQFNEQAYYKQKQKELTGAYKASSQIYKKQQVKKDGDKFQTYQNHPCETTASTIDSNYMQPQFRPEPKLNDQQVKTNWQSNHWNQNPAQYNVHYTQKEFEVDYTLKQQQVSKSIQMTSAFKNEHQDMNLARASNQVQPTNSGNQQSNGMQKGDQASNASGFTDPQGNQTTQTHLKQTPDLVNIVDPMKSYQAQHFQNQNLMLNRDPEFLLKQHLLQQQLIKKYHMERSKLAEQIAAKNQCGQEQIQGNSQNQIQSDNQQERTSSIQQILYNKLGYAQHANYQEEQQRPLMFEKGSNKVKASNNEGSHNKEAGNTSEAANVKVEQSSLLATSFDNQDAERAFSDKPKSLSQMQQNFEGENEESENQSGSYQDKGQFIYNKDRIQNDFKSYEPQLAGQFPSYEVLTNNNYDDQKPSSLDLAFDNDDDQNKSKRSIFSGDFGTYNGEQLEDKKCQIETDWKSQQNLSKDSLSCKSPDFIPNWNNEQPNSNSSFILDRSVQQIQNSHQNNESETLSQSKQQLEQDAQNISDVKSLQNFQQQPKSYEHQRLSSGQQNPNYEVINSNNANPQRFSNFSDSVNNAKHQKPSSVYDQSDNRSSHTSNLCSSVDPKECIDNLEQMIAGDLNFLESIQYQSNDLMARIGNKITQNMPDLQYDQNQVNQSLIQSQIQMQYGTQQAMFAPQINPMSQNFVQQQKLNTSVQSQKPHYGIPHQQQQNYQRNYLVAPHQNMYNQELSLNSQGVSPHQFGGYQNQVQSNGLSHSSKAFIPVNQVQNQVQNDLNQRNYQGNDGYWQKKNSGKSIDKILQQLQSQNQKSGKGQMTLDDMAGNELECCKDQKCSRFIQKRIMEDSTTVEERNRFLDSILKNSNVRFESLVMDSFGNYVIQKIQQIPSIDIVYLDIIFENLIGSVMKYSTHKHGCRVVQTGFEVFQISQKERMMQELLDSNRVKECSFNFNGNHVIQQIIIQMGNQTQSQKIVDIIQQIEMHLMDYCVNEFCCRIVQRMIEYCHPKLVEKTNFIILSNFYQLNQNEFGIFVLSSILDHGQDTFKDQILKNVQGNAASMSLRKDGSKLVENCMKMVPYIQYGGKHEAQAALLLSILDELIYLPLNSQNIQIGVKQIGQQSPIYFTDLLTNKFANYVVQTMFEVSGAARREIILGKIQTSLKEIHDVKNTPLKHILKFMQKHNIYLRGGVLQYGQHGVGTTIQPFAQNSQNFSHPPQMPMSIGGQQFQYQQQQFQQNPHNQASYSSQNQQLVLNNQLMYPNQQYQQQQIVNNGQQMSMPQQHSAQQYQSFYGSLGGVNQTNPQSQSNLQNQQQQQQLISQFGMLGLQNVGSIPNATQNSGHQQNVNNYHY